MRSISSFLLSAVIVIPSLFAASEAAAFVNEIRIQVAKSRLGQCGVNWNPEWRSPFQGRVWVMGKKVTEFNLKNQTDCDRVRKVKVNVPANFKIDVLVEVFTKPQNFRMAAPLTTVAADRVWNVNFFNDSASGEVVSTNWPPQGAFQPMPIKTAIMRLQNNWNVNNDELNIPLYYDAKFLH